MLEFWVAEEGKHKIVSAIARVEACSAICRLRKESRMTAREASMALRAVVAEIQNLNEQRVSRRVLGVASALVDRRTLRSLDAVQLSSAVVIRDLMPAADMRFITSDHTLLNAAQEEGFAVWNPCEGGQT